MITGRKIAHIGIAVNDVNADAQRRRARFQAVFNGIFDERLKDDAGHRNRTGALVDFTMNFQFVPKA